METYRWMSRRRLTFLWRPKRRKLLLILLSFFLLYLVFNVNNIMGWTFCSTVYFVDRADITVNRDSSWNSDKFLQNNEELFPVNCEAIFRGDEREITRVEEAMPCIARESRDEQYYTQETKNCEAFIRERGYYDYAVTEDEKEFPLAFSILMFDHVEQAERLLRAIYRPHNIYCIHVDGGSPAPVLEAMLAISNCFDNVLIASQLIDVDWGTFSVVEAEISCMKTLIKYKHWKYLINLTGQEFPLRTNWELVQILKAYNGSNDIMGFTKGRPKSWTVIKWYSPNLPLPVFKSEPPHGYIIHKGPTHIAVTRNFVDFALHDSTALDLLEWMKTMRVPDEHYFNTLNHNPQFQIPGAYTGYPDNKTSETRYKIWKLEGLTCAGTWVHAICTFGAGDLQALVKAKTLFANKFRLDLDPVALHCMEKWYYARVRTDKQGDFDISYYKKLPWVKQHVHV